MKFPGESVDNWSVHRAEKNITFKISFWKRYNFGGIKTFGEVHLGFINSFLLKKKKDSQVHIFKLLQMYLFFNTTLPIVFKEINPAFGLDKN